VELINLGLGGGAPLDAFTPRALRDAPANLIRIKIGINLINTDLVPLHAFTRRCTASSTPSARGTPPRGC
jgi:hypothetical protein